jgi:hypothetical protein
VQAAPVALRALPLLEAAPQLAVKINNCHLAGSYQQVLVKAISGATSAETQCIVVQPVFAAETISKMRIYSYPLFWPLLSRIP